MKYIPYRKINVYEIMKDFVFVGFYKHFIDILQHSGNEQTRAKYAY